MLRLQRDRSLSAVKNDTAADRLASVKLKERSSVIHRCQMSVWVGASRRFRVSIALIVVFLAAQQPAAVRRTSPADSFERAKQLAWLNNWAEASRVLARLQRSGRLELDERNRTLARAVEIRGNIESLSQPSAAGELDRLLATAGARSEEGRV